MCIRDRYDIAVLLVAHPRKSRDAFSNDDVAGSADITNRVDVVVNYARNPDKAEDEPASCDSLLAVTKNRLFGTLTKAKAPIELFYSRRSKRITSRDAFAAGVKRYGWEQERTDAVGFAEI